MYEVQYLEGSGTPLLFVECTVAIDGQKEKITHSRAGIDIQKEKKTLLLLAFTLGFKSLMTKVNS
jgi:hypothetical protein